MTSDPYGNWSCSACGDQRIRVEPVCRCGRTREQDEALEEERADREKRLSLAGVPPFADHYRTSTGAAITSGAGEVERG
jgi:hypothetical protein